MDVVGNFDHTGISSADLVRFSLNLNPREINAGLFLAAVMIVPGEFTLTCSENIFDVSLNL